MPDIDIPYQKRVLDNGLRLIAHQDAKLPIVTTSLWYHVGSKNESPGRTGFAHLFEHLMFEGSKHHDGEYFRPLELAGASEINGTTSRDRTNYYQTVPTDAFDLALWLESDRMGHFLGALTQEKLDEQREVVRNEKRQSDNQPYGRVSAALSRSLYPAAHPYSWPVIGSMDDLDAADLDDMRRWFKTHYRPNNAVLVLSGDVEPERALDQAERHFAAIESGRPVERPSQWMARLGDPRRLVLEDRVPQARIYRAWNVPAIDNIDHQPLSLLTSILSHGKSSRLYHRLVHEEQIATAASAYLWSGEIGSTLVVQVSCAPGSDPVQVEEIMDQELSRLLSKGISADELERAKSRALSGFLHRLQRTGGSGGKSEVLAHGEVYHRNAGHFRISLQEIEGASVSDIDARAAQWLDEQSLTLTVRPVPRWNPSGQDVDRSQLPKQGKASRSRLPETTTASLSNGLRLICAPWGDLPLAQISLLSDAGFASERELPRGTANLTMAAIDEGTASLSGLEINDRLASLGARLAAGAGLDTCRLGLASLTSNLTESLEIFAEVLRGPLFPEEEVARLKKELLARIARERSAPVQLALRVLPKLLYGEGHPYALSFTGSGSEPDVDATGREQLTEFHASRIGPDRSTLLCLGRFDQDQVIADLERLLENWQPTTIPGDGALARASGSTGRIVLLDRPGSIQTTVFGGQVVPARGDACELPLEIFNFALGGAFSSRLNLNLREDKGWTYGAHSLLWSARGDRPFLVYASVQADRTVDTIIEMRREISELLGKRTLTPDELEMARNGLVRSLPANWETLRSLSGSLEELITYNLPPDYFDSYVEGILDLSATSVTESARKQIHVDDFIWVVVGDLSQIRPQFEASDLGPLEELDDPLI